MAKQRSAAEIYEETIRLNEQVAKGYGAVTKGYESALADRKTAARYQNWTILLIGAAVLIGYLRKK